MTAVSEVPVWVNGVEKWVTGVGKRTTCGDMVKVLLATDRPTDELTDADLKSYAIVERWRKVERPLDPDARILKVWKAWGDDNADVRFTLKKLCPMKPKEMKTLRRRHQSRHRWRSTSSLETIHPRKLGDSGPEGVQHHDMLERLMRMIVAQGETIQAQLRRLQEREELIGYYEHQMHKKRADQLGSDYLLRTYLRDGEAEETEKTSNDSGLVADLCEPAAAAAAVGTALPGSSSEQETLQQLQHTLHYLESVVQLNQRICEQEETALRLSHKIRRARTGAEAAGSGGGADTELLLELEVSRTELQRLAAVCARQDAQIEQNERALLEFERLIEDKRRHLRYLEHQLAEADSETERLVSEQRRQLTVLPRPSVPADDHTQPPYCPSAPACPGSSAPDSGSAVRRPGEEGDSNSDTGLSSLHSSSDEAENGYVLDTLV